ncbi:MAG: glycosyltransferase, partial [Chlamydiia bacterium]|nr:glycosyltransferase [Chlamydiia bacterium]
MKEVAILLSTYQGERYLEEQLASLLNQTHTDLHIIVRDDGSTDRTREILRLWSGRFASWREITDGVNLGPAASFAKLLDAYRLDSSSPYAMFCD